MQARGKSVTAMCAKPKMLGMVTKATAEKRPVATPKSCLIHRNITVTKPAKKCKKKRKRAGAAKKKKCKKKKKR